MFRLQTGLNAIFVQTGDMKNALITMAPGLLFAIYVNDIVAQSC